MTFPADRPFSFGRIERGQGIGKEIRVAEISKILTYVYCPALQVRLGVPVQERKSTPVSISNLFIWRLVIYLLIICFLFRP